MPFEVPAPRDDDLWWKGPGGWWRWNRPPNRFESLLCSTLLEFQDGYSRRAWNADKVGMVDDEGGFVHHEINELPPGGVWVTLKAIDGQWQPREWFA